MAKFCKKVWLEFEKAIVISQISALEFLKNESLTHTVNFGISSAFSKGPWFSFLESPGPLYKVYQSLQSKESQLQRCIQICKNS